MELGVKLAWGLKAGYLSVLGDRARPPQPAAFARGGLFSLPVCVPHQLKWGSAGDELCSSSTMAADRWVSVGCAALNSPYGLPGQGTRRQPGKVHVAALDNLRSKAKRFLSGDSKPDFTFQDVVAEQKKNEFLIQARKSISHNPLPVSRL